MKSKEKSDHTYLLAFIASKHNTYDEWDERFEMNAVISPSNKDPKETKNYFMTMIHLLMHCTHLLNTDEEFLNFVREDLEIKEKLERGNNVISIFSPSKGSA